MVNGDGNGDKLSCQKYGFPLYGAAWVPPSTTVKEDRATESEPPSCSSVDRLVVLSGGGGEGNNGFQNALLISSFDFESNSLSDHPVARLETGSNLPYRIAVHPGGEGIICSFPKSCRWFEWNSPTSTDEKTLSLRSSEKALEQLEDVGQQLAMTFNSEGSLLAVGGEDGKLRVFKWPTMESTLTEADAHSSVQDLDFSLEGNFLVSVGIGRGRIWNVATSTSVASLPKQDGEKAFCYCRFSRTTDRDQVVYITALGDKGSCIVKWNTSSWKRISSTHVTCDAISAFNVSPDGKLLAIGTNEGDIVIISSASMRVQTVVREAHLIAVTVLAFSLDSRALVSASAASSARVTLIKDKKKDGVSLCVILLVILLALAILCGKQSTLFLELILSNTWFCNRVSSNLS